MHTKGIGKTTTTRAINEMVDVQPAINKAVNNKLCANITNVVNNPIYECTKGDQSDENHYEIVC